MAGLLTDLLAAGLIEKLDGDDERFAKMERAAEAVAQELVAHPPDLIRATLAGLDPNVPADDPAIAQARKALVSEWKSMGSVYPSPPVGLFRAILLEACSQAAERNNAAILWLTAADTLPWMRLGREEPAVRRMLEMLAMRTENAALEVPSMPTSKRQAVLKMEVPAPLTAPTLHKVNRQDLSLRVAAAVGPLRRGNQKLTNNPNTHWPGANQPWAWDFSDRMHAVLADELDALASDLGKHQLEMSQQIHASQSRLIKTLSNALTSQQRWAQDALKASEARQQADQLRLNVLWWSEALYSPSMHCGYRELPPSLAAVVMAVDLLDQVTKPTPASVAYLLAETVHGLPEADFGRERTLPELLRALREARGQLPRGWMDQLTPPPPEGQLSLRDLVVLALGDQQWNLDEVIGRAGLTGEVALSLPVLARALFRQEQAVQLAGSDQ